MFESKGTYTVKYRNEVIGECKTIALAKTAARDHASDIGATAPKRWTWESANGVKTYYWREHDYTISVPDGA